MSKRPSDKLFTLIKSLSGSEKRYFKVFVRHHSVGSDNKYMDLFEAIDQQEEFKEEELIKSVYQDLQNIKSRKYSELKSYLYDLILRALQAFDEAQNYNFRIRRLINNVEVLYNRSQNKAASNQLAKAKKMVVAREDYASWLTLMRWSKKLTLAKRAGKNELDLLNSINEENQKVLMLQSNLEAYRDLFFQIMFLINKDPLRRDEKHSNILKTIIDHELLTHENRALSYRAKCLYHRIKSLCAYTILDHAAFHDHSKILVELFESNSVIAKEETTEYIAILSNYALSCGLLEKYDEVSKIIPKYLNIKAKKEIDKIKIHWQYYGLSFALSIYTGEFNKGKELLEEHLEKVKDFGNKGFDPGSLYHYYFYIYFGVEEYDLALRYLNEWLNLPRSGKRQDLQSISRILNLILHFEMKNFNLLDYLFRSSYRYLKKRDRLYLVEKKLITLLRNASKSFDSKEVKKEFEEMKMEFETLKHDPTNKVLFQYFDFVAWIESKINKMPFPEVIKKRHFQKSKS